MKIFLLVIFLWIVPLSAKDPEIFYLTWTQDPSTTMIVEWHSKGRPTPQLFFHEEGGKEWFQQQTQSNFLKDNKIYINSVELTGLNPDTRYYIQFEKKGARYYFRTLPKNLSSPIRFAVGGDVFLDFRLFKRINKQILSTNPDFIVLGGDLAYAENPKGLFESKKTVVHRWESFFRNLKQATVTTDHRIIPILPIVGNHDITKLERKEKQTPFFYHFFPHFENYRVLKLNSEIALFLLDTGHFESVQGKQTEWLEQTLNSEANTRYKIPLYHVAAYPSYYSFDNHRAKIIRENWVPLFEKYQVKFAFEHHNHAFKRTFPLKENKIDPSGVIYLGDGSWGVEAREVKNHWYLEKAGGVNAFWLAIFDQNQCHLQSFDEKGALVDEFKIK